MPFCRNFAPPLWRRTKERSSGESTEQPRQSKPTPAPPEPLLPTLTQDMSVIPSHVMVVYAGDSIMHATDTVTRVNGECRCVCVCVSSCVCARVCRCAMARLCELAALPWITPSKFAWWPFCRFLATFSSPGYIRMKLSYGSAMWVISARDVRVGLLNFFVCLPGVYLVICRACISLRE